MKFLSIFLGCLLAVSLIFLLVYLRRWQALRKRCRELETELGRQKELAAEEQKRKKDLVAFLAHDLKTPLTSVVGYLTLLRDKPTLEPPQRHRYTTIALDKALRLEHLLEEFFDISRMELQDEVCDEIVQLTLLLDQLTDEFYPLFQEKQLRLETTIQEGLKTHGNAEKLARVFDNVLKNAISYSLPGTAVTLTAKREKDEKIHIFISNEGLEIPEKELSSIFDKFYRSDAARSSATGGAGLGLAIAKEIVVNHNGSISAESTGKTTVFHIILPSG